MGTLSDYGINETFMRLLSEKMQPGSSAIFMLIRHATVDKVKPEISKKLGGHILYTDQPANVEARYEKLPARASQPTASAQCDSSPPGSPLTMPA
jgi:uncharacterized membrane protein